MIKATAIFTLCMVLSGCWVAIPIINFGEVHLHHDGNLIDAFGSTSNDRRQGIEEDTKTKSELIQEKIDNLKGENQ